jgi:hypothetical protein
MNRFKQTRARLSDSFRRGAAEAGFPLLARLRPVLSVETTSACNAKCGMCPNPVLPRPRMHMSEAVFAEVLKQLPALNPALVILSMIGEPLLDPGIRARVKAVAALGFRTRIVTNASLLDEAAAAGLIGAGLAELHASLNGWDAAEHQELMNFAEPCRERCEQNLKRFAAKSAGRVKLHLNILSRRPPPQGALGLTLRRWRGLGYDVDYSKPAPWHKARPGTGRRYPCRLLFSELFVDSRGSVSACCRDYGDSLSVGSVMETTLSALWRGEKLQRLRRLHLDGEAGALPVCAGCTLSAGVDLRALTRALLTRRHHGA